MKVQYDKIQLMIYLIVNCYKKTHVQVELFKTNEKLNFYRYLQTLRRLNSKKSVKQENQPRRLRKLCNMLSSSV